MVSLLGRLQTIWRGLQYWTCRSCGTVASVLVRRNFHGAAMQAVSGGVEHNSASPDCLELLHNEWMGQQALRLGPYGDLQSRDASCSWLSFAPLGGVPIGSRFGIPTACGKTLQRVEIIREGIYIQISLGREYEN